MGVLVSCVDSLKPKIDYIAATADVCNTNRLYDELVHTVFHCFYQLKPLSYEPKIVCELEEKRSYYGSVYLSVGEWVRCKYSTAEKIGHEISEYDFLHYMIRYGDLLKPWVRKPIREDFAALVDLVKQLKPYNTLHFSLEIPQTKVKKIWIGGELKQETYIATKIGFSTCYPRRLHLNSEGVSLDVTDVEDLFALEDIIDYVVELYRMGYGELLKVIRHNEAILAKMKEIAKPYEISNSLAR